jgi:hypothetical protein
MALGRLSEIDLLIHILTILLCCKYIDTIQKNTEALLDASKEVGFEANSDKTKYMLMSLKKAG